MIHGRAHHCHVLGDGMRGFPRPRLLSTAGNIVFVGMRLVPVSNASATGLVVFTGLVPVVVANTSRVLPMKLEAYR